MYNADVMSPVAAISSMFRQYGKFRGRASRAEFWWAFLFVVALQVAAAAIFTPLPLVLALVGLPVIVPFLAVTVRRLHDTRRSKQFTSVLPAAAMVVLVVGVYVALADVDMSDGYAGLVVIGIIFVAAIAGGLLLGVYLIAGLVLQRRGADMEEHRSVTGVLKLPGLSILLLVVVGGGLWLPSKVCGVLGVGVSILHDEFVFGVFGGAVLVVLGSFPLALLVHLASSGDPEQNPYGPSPRPL